MNNVRQNELEGNGASCPIMPAKLPWYKKVCQCFFRFGVCPLCIIRSCVYSIRRYFRKP